MELPLSDLASLWLAPDSAPMDARSTEATDERSDEEAWADLEERVSAARAIF
jgi:hypothetical protein